MLVTRRPSSRGFTLIELLGCHCDHCGFYCLALAGRAGCSRSCPPRPVHRINPRLCLRVGSAQLSPAAELLSPRKHHFSGPTGDLGWGWNASWAVFMLPNLEQQPLVLMRITSPVNRR